MKWTVITLGTLAAALTLPVAGAQTAGEKVTPQIAAELVQRFRPQVVTDAYAHWDELDRISPTWAAQWLAARGSSGTFFGPLGYWELHFRDDPRTYVMLVWFGDGGVYWVLVRQAGDDWEVVSEAERWLGIGTDPAWVSRADLDGDGEAEVLVASGDPGRHIECLFAYRWTGERLELITPYEDERWPEYLPAPRPEDEWKLDRGSDVCTDNVDVDITDLDGDGKAELVVYPPMERVPEGDYGFQWVFADEDPRVKVYALHGGRYALEEEVTTDEWIAGQRRERLRTPTTAIAAVHPGTIVASTLTVETDGVLRVFVSVPAYPDTGEDWDPEGFRLQFADCGVRFVREWKNVDFPSPLDGNVAFQGVPVRQEPRSGRGAWEVDPARPAVPAPDPEWRYRLTGPYVELEVDRALAYPYLAEAARRFFEGNPEKETAWLSLPLEGRLLTGRRVLIEAFVCIRRAGYAAATGSAAGAAPTRDPATPPPDHPHG